MDVLRPYKTFLGHLRRHWLSNERGQLYLEILIALMVLALAVTAVSVVVGLTLNNPQFQEKRSSQAALIGEGFEAVTALQRGNWGDLYSPPGGKGVPHGISNLSDAIAYWPLDENAGSLVNDRSNNGHTGSLVNAPTWQSGGSCKLVNCLAFDGTNDYASVPHTDLLNPASFTVAAWVKTTQGSIGRLVTKESSQNGQQRYSLAVNIDAGKAEIRFDASDGSGAVRAVSTTNITDGNWHHVAGVFDDAGDVLRLYVNGTPEATVSTAKLLPPSPNPLYLGRFDEQFGQYLNGSMDDVRIYDRPLSDREVAQLADTGTVFSWKLSAGAQNITVNTISYTRSVVIENVSRTQSNGGGEIETGGYTSERDDPTTQKVTVTVSMAGDLFLPSLTQSRYYTRNRVIKDCIQNDWSTNPAQLGPLACPPSPTTFGIEHGVNTEGDLSLPAGVCGGTVESSVFKADASVSPPPLSLLTMQWDGRVARPGGAGSIPPNIEQQINIIDTRFVEAFGFLLSDSRTIVPGVITFDATQFTNATVYFEVEAKRRGSFDGSVALYQGSSAVPGATLAYTSSGSYLLRSGPLTLTGSRQYHVRARLVDPLIAARLVIVQNNLDTVPAPKTETQIEIGNHETTTSSSSTSLTHPKLWRYDASKYDGTITRFFEATLSTTAGGTAVAELWETGGASALVTLSTTATTQTLIRSAPIALTDGKEYVVKIRNATSGRTTTLGNAKIIIQQTSFQKLRTYRQIINTAKTYTNDDYGRVLEYFNPYNLATFAGSDVVAHYEATMKGNATGSSALLPTPNVTVPASTGKVGNYVKLIVDQDDKLRVAYYNETDRNLIYTERRVCLPDGGWSTVTVDGGSTLNGGTNGNVGKYLSLGLSAAGLPRLSYYDASNRNIKYAECTAEPCAGPGADANWTKVIVDAAGLDIDIATSLSVNAATNTTHIAYHQRETAGGTTVDDLKYRVCTHPVSCADTARWSAPVVVHGDGNGSGNYGSRISTAIYGGKVGIAYTDKTDPTNAVMRYAECLAGCTASPNWQNGFVLGGDQGGARVPFPSLRFTSSGAPRIVSTYFHLRYLSCVANCTSGAAAWSNLLVKDFADGSAEGVAGFILSADDKPRVALPRRRSGGDDDLFYARCDANCENDAGQWRINYMDQASDAGYPASLGIDSFGLPHVAYYDQGKRDLKVISCVTEICFVELPTTSSASYARFTSNSFYLFSTTNPQWTRAVRDGFMSTARDVVISTSRLVLDFTPDLASLNSVSFQIAAASDPSGPWNYVGPDCTANTRYVMTDGNVNTPVNITCSSQANTSYFRYKVLMGKSIHYSPGPLVSEVRIRYAQ